MQDVLYHSRVSRIFQKQNEAFDINDTQVKIPRKSLLNPSRTAAVCGGNVLTSQRIVDVVLKAFHAAAASQGCTKCVTLRFV